MVEPEVPVIVTVAVPTVALAEAVSVRVEVTLPLAGGVTGLVENAAVTVRAGPITVPDATPVATPALSPLLPVRLVA